MAIADTITTLGNNIVSLIGTRANKDLSNLSATGEAKITASSASVPVGTVIAYMGTSVPDGYLLMDGREVSKTTYSDLYNVIGDTQGTATSSDNFVIADMTDGRYLMGSTVAGGSLSQTLPNIVGTYVGSNLMGGEAVEERTGALYRYTGNSTNYDAAYGSNSSYGLGFDASKSSSIYKNSANVRPLSRKTKFFIRYKKK